MSLNMDRDDGYTPWPAEPTAEEAAEAAKARYVVRAIGDTKIAGYSEDTERAYGRAAYIALHSMQEFGAQVEVTGLPGQIVEFRITEENRGLVTMQWVNAEQENTDTSNLKNR